MYPVDQLWAETVYIAYYLHWPLGEILDLEHPARARVIEEITRINAELAVGSVPSAEG
jgi:hypothetical protein